VKIGGLLGKAGTQNARNAAATIAKGDASWRGEIATAAG
jgi:hypothetical protein